MHSDFPGRGEMEGGSGVDGKETGGKVEGQAVSDASRKHSQPQVSSRLTPQASSSSRAACVSTRRPSPGPQQPQLRGCP